MTTKEIEECTEELYAIHKDLADIHSEALDRLSNLTESNTQVIKDAETLKIKLQFEIRSEIREYKAYHTKCMLWLMGIVGVTFIVLGWQLWSFKKDMDGKMYTTYSAFNKVVMRQEEQNKVLERIEELEKNKIGNKGEKSP